MNERASSIALAPGANTRSTVNAVYVATLGIGDTVEFKFAGSSPGGNVTFTNAHALFEKLG